MRLSKLRKPYTFLVINQVSGRINLDEGESINVTGNTALDAGSGIEFRPADLDNFNVAAPTELITTTGVLTDNGANLILGNNNFLFDFVLVNDAQTLSLQPSVGNLAAASSDSNVASFANALQPVLNNGSGNTAFVDTVMRTSSPWRDMPEHLPAWQSVYSRFRKWTRCGLWEFIISFLNEHYGDSDFMMIDGSGVRVHQDVARVADSKFAQAMSRSKGGLSTKIHMACDTLGYPLSFILTGAERHEATQAKALLKQHIKPGQYCLMDAGYDSDDIRKFVMQNNATAVIAYRKNRVHIPELNNHTYKERHKVENLFQKLKRFRRIATRYEKLQINYAGMHSHLDPELILTRIMH